MYVARRSAHLRPIATWSTPCVAGPSTPRTRPRRYASSSTPRSAQAQLRETEDADPVPPPPSITPLWSRPMIQLPSPLPPDSVQEASKVQHAFYPGTGVIDSISMISMCLRRPEHIPRAYAIFQTMLRGLESGSAGVPDAQIFGKVAEGTASLSQPGTGSEWRRKAWAVVQHWERLHGGVQNEPCLVQDGAKVYAGWLTGTVKAEAPLTPLLPYMAHEDFHLPEIMASVPVEMEKKVLAKVLEVAKKEGMDRLVHEAMALIDDSLEMERREQEQLNPTRQNAFKNPEMERDTPRAEVLKLRETLAQLDSSTNNLIRQKNLEEAAYDTTRNSLAQTPTSTDSARLRDIQLKGHQLQTWMHEWASVVTEKLREDIAEMTRRIEANEKMPMERKRPAGPTGRKVVEDSDLLLYLQLLPPEKLALIAVVETMRNVASAGTVLGGKAATVMVAISKAVEAEFQAEMIKQNFGASSAMWQRLSDEMTQRNRVAVRQTWARIGSKLDEGEKWDKWRDVWTPNWSIKAHIDLGGYLLSQIVKSTKVTRTIVDPVTGEEETEEQAAFSHSYEYVKGHKQGVINGNPAVMQRLSSDSVSALLPPRYLPMLVPPRPWTDHDKGGYLFHDEPVMRHKAAQEQAEYLRAAIRSKHAEPVLHGLDVLSSTAWRINKDVFKVMFEVWQSGERLADIPPSESGNDYAFPEVTPSATADPEERTAYIQTMRNIALQQRKDHGERCRINYTLEVANTFQDETFYLPHNVDFRGRAYPIPPHLSPVGDDLNRGLLKFARKKALGETGLKWLRIHLANVFGYDKASFAERVKFAEEHEADIFDSAENPLTGNRWWLKAEDPWQCLATCFELKAALHSPDPTAYESNLPVHQDGTCNGMQHYAALGGDVRGAKAVNLENGDRPADIYTRVVEIVNRVIEQDKANGHEVASWIKDPLSRKIVKQTVMTTVYGVTFIGAKDQISKQLEERTDLDQSKLWAVSSYVAKVVLSCIGDLFSGARDIQDWLTSCARLISKSIPPERLERAAERGVQDAKAIGRGTPQSVGKNQAKELMSSVIWTTPLGLPIVQPYRKPKSKQVMTALQSVYISDPSQTAEVSSQKQASAFPPNFVHSLDATHMFLTALACEREAITFASVHDSYWTHAATVEGMSELIREAFISLHTQDLIGELRKEFLIRYGENWVPWLSARKVQYGVFKRQMEEDARRAKVRAAMEYMNKPSASSSDSKAHTLTQEVVSAAHDVMEDGELDLAKPSNDDNVGLTEAQGEEMLRDRMAEWEMSKQELLHREASQSFIKFKDMLWVAPSRGMFDVERIKQSTYFFS